MKEQDPGFTHFQRMRGCRRLLRYEDESLAAFAKQLSKKLEDGDKKDAVRSASSDNRLTDFSDENLATLQSKHLGPPPDSASLTPPPPKSDLVNEMDVA